MQLLNRVIRLKNLLMNGPLLQRSAWQGIALLLVSIGSIAAANAAIQPDIAPTSMPAIQTLQQAEQALHDAADSRAATNLRYQTEQRACYIDFFINVCLARAKETRRVALTQLKKIEIDARAFKRQAQLTQRQAAAPASAQPMPEIGAGFNTPLLDEQIKSTVTETTDSTQQLNLSRPAPHNRKPRSATPAVAEKDQKERLSNLAAYEKKSRDALLRQQEIAAKKTRREREINEKNKAGSSS